MTSIMFLTEVYSEKSKPKRALIMGNGGCHFSPAEETFSSEKAT